MDSETKSAIRYLIGGGTACVLGVALFVRHCNPSSAVSQWMAAWFDIPIELYNRRGSHNQWLGNLLSILLIALGGGTAVISGHWLSEHGVHSPS